ncbi:MAG: DUF2202 domain-containing protein [Ignavibacteriales bacterium]|nr:DUF2202 domain-containing protein [Ignavibacteriales bacterium]
MKIFSTLVLVLLTYFSLSAQNCGHKNKSKENCKGGKGNCIQAIDSIKYDLSSSEKDGLIYMRLEEKLARDVYLTLGKTYKQKMFVNIPESEQRHMDAVKALLDKYEVIDPVTDDEIGSFTSTDFKKLYDDLVTKGQQSFKDAMLVGKEIEEMDIKDLVERIEQTDNPDIKSVYENLKQGSENHLKAFTNHL